MKVKNQRGIETEITIEQFGELCQGSEIEVLQITEISHEEKAILKERYPENYMDPDEMQDISQQLIAEAMQLSRKKP